MAPSKRRQSQKCRLCNITISKTNSQAVYDNFDKLTTLGEKMCYIISSEVSTMIQLPKFCCGECKLKIENCFNLIQEVRAAHLSILNIHSYFTYNKVSLPCIYDKEVSKFENFFNCPDCEATCSNFIKFSEHHGSHMLQDTSVDPEISISVRDAVSVLKLENDPDLNLDSSTHQVSHIPHDHLYCKNFNIKTEIDTSNNVAEQTNEALYINDAASDQEKTRENLEDRRNVVVMHNWMKIPTDPSSKYDCHHCGIGFKIKKNLRLHIFRAHHSELKNKLDDSIKREKICRYCSASVHTSVYVQHFRLCKNEYKTRNQILCHLCGQDVFKSNWNSHMFRHREQTKGTHLCTICNKVYKTRVTLTKHMLLHDENKKIICEVCGLKIPKHSRWKHIKQYHAPRKECPICNKGFAFDYLLKAHIKAHETDTNFNMLSTGYVLQCVKCEKQFSFSKMLDLHMELEHNDFVETKACNYPCTECDNAYDDLYSLKNHLLLMHGITTETLSRRSYRHMGTFPCHVCERVLSSEFGLRAHIKKLHGSFEKDTNELIKRDCELCGRIFSNKHSLTAHINAVHLKVGIKSCELCGKSFTRYQGYINHKLAHKGVKPFECEVCNRTFRQRCDVVRHLQRHVRDGDATLETAVARNNNGDTKVLKPRIFLKAFGNTL